MHPRLLPLCAILLSTGCGSWDFVSIPYRYQEPPELPLEGLATYAVLVGNTADAEFEERCVVPGLERVERATYADVVVRVQLGELREDPLEVVQQVQWTARGERAFNTPRYTFRRRYVIPLKYQLLDRSRGDRVLRQGEKEYVGLFLRPGMLFSTPDKAEAWYREQEGAAWVVQQQRAEAAHAALDMLQELVDEVTSPQRRMVRLRLTKDSPELEGFQRGFVAVRDARRRPADAQAAREIYASIGNPLHAADDPEDASQHRHAMSCGLAACAFLVGDYRQAREHALAALEQRPSTTVEEFVPHCETMIRRTELVPPQPRSANRPD